MAYIGKEPASGIRSRFIFTATAGQTTFSGADDESRTLNYTDGHFTDVFLNGVKLDKSDYTATSGTSIVLDEGAAASDILEVVAYDTFSVFNGEFSQDVTIGADLTVDTDTLYVDSTNDRVGIGNTSPQTSLFVGDGSGTEGITIYSGASNEGQLRFADGTSGSALYQGRIEYNHSTSKLFLGAGGTTPVVIDSSGNVGIGVTSPTYRIEAATTSGGNGIKITRGSDSFFQQFQGTTGGVSLAASGSGGYLALRTGTTAGTTTERMRLRSDGNVGLGYAGASTVKFFVVDDSSGNYNGYFQADNGSYAGVNLVSQVQRASSTAYDIMGMYALSDAEFRFRGDGNAFADGSFSGGGADYAEYFEWDDDNTSNEDRRGFSVVLTNGNKIRKATSSDARRHYWCNFWQSISCW